MTHVNNSNVDIYIFFGVAFHLCFLSMFILEGPRPFAIVTPLIETCLALSTVTTQGKCLHYDWQWVNECQIKRCFTL